MFFFIAKKNFKLYGPLNAGLYSLVDESWNQLIPVLNLGVFNSPTKNSNSSYST